MSAIILLILALMSAIGQGASPADLRVEVLTDREAVVTWPPCPGEECQYAYVSIEPLLFCTTASSMWVDAEGVEHVNPTTETCVDSGQEQIVVEVGP